MKTQIILDMDGVLADFWKGTIKAHGILMTLEQFFSENLGSYNVLSMLQHYMPELGYDYFWRTKEAKFWAELQPMQDCFKILKFLEDRYGRENIVLWSTPCAIATTCVEGKLEWIRKYLPEHYSHPENYNFGGRKWIGANQHTILIDDHDENCKLFFEKGGHSCLVPRLWNMDYPNRHVSLERMKYHLATIDTLIEEGH